MHAKIFSFLLLVASAQAQNLPTDIPASVYSLLGVPTNPAAQTSFELMLATNSAALASFTQNANSVISSLESSAGAQITGGTTTSSGSGSGATTSSSSTGNAAPMQTPVLGLGLSGIAVAGLFGAAAFL